MKIEKRYNRAILTLALLMVALLSLEPLRAQHTFGVLGGYGSGSEKLYTAVEGRTLYGLQNYGVSWRTYSAERYVGCFGLDLIYMQRGFSFSPATISATDEVRYYYTRNINSLMLPIVWQPHLYIFDHRVRLFFEAAATFSYDINSTYDNDYARQVYANAGIFEGEFSGEYHYKTARDNRFGYGLMGGGGLAYLTRKFEFLANIRYYYGLSDVVRNRNKYYDNGTDGFENPFSLSPIRSPIQNLMISFGVNYHFGAEGFAAWETKRVKVKMKREFDYSGKK